MRNNESIRTPTLCVPSTPPLALEIREKHLEESNNNNNNQNLYRSTYSQNLNGAREKEKEKRNARQLCRYMRNKNRCHLTPAYALNAEMKQTV